MKKITTTSLIIIALFAVLSSCNQAKYSYLKKVEASHHTAQTPHPKNSPANTELATPTNNIPLPTDTSTIVLQKAVVKDTLTSTQTPSLAEKKYADFQKTKFAKAVHKVLPESNDHYHMHGGLLWTIVMVLLVLWLLSLLTGGWGLGGLLYIFLVVALVIILLRILGIV